MTTNTFCYFILSVANGWQCLLSFFFWRVMFWPFHFLSLSVVVLRFYLLILLCHHSTLLPRYLVWSDKVPVQYYLLMKEVLSYRIALLGGCSLLSSWVLSFPCAWIYPAIGSAHVPFRTPGLHCTDNIAFVARVILTILIFIYALWLYIYIHNIYLFLLLIQKKTHRCS